MEIRRKDKDTKGERKEGRKKRKKKVRVKKEDWRLKVKGIESKCCKESIKQYHKQKTYQSL